MFLGAVSMAKERQASSRSTSSSSSSSSSSSKILGSGGIVFTKIEGFDDDEIFLKPSGLRLMERGEKGPILYGNPSDPNLPPRDIILSYFQDCSTLMLDQTCLESIIRQSETTGLPLHHSAMQFQRSVMEFNFQIEPNFGCGYLGKLPSLFPDDIELLNTAKNFMFIALRSYVEAVKIRSNKFKTLKSSGGFSKISMMEFFESCNAKSKYSLLILLLFFSCSSSHYF